MNKYQQWAESVKTALEEAGLDRVSIEPSNVTFSPHEYVYVYATSHGVEGRHALISEASELELGSTRIWIGVYDGLTDFQDGLGAADEVATISEAVTYVKERLS